MKKVLQFSLTIFLSAIPIHAQQIGSIQTPLQRMWLKSENGLILAWHKVNVRGTDGAGIVRVFDDHGHAIASLNVLQAVPGANNVSIWDVSAKPQQSIAVGATYTKSGPSDVSSTLLYFNSDGTLASAFALEPQKEIALLELDDSLNAWTVTWSTYDNASSSPSLVVEYDSHGSVVRQLLARTLFPPHETAIVQNPQVGFATGGFDSGNFWFWLPSSTDLVTIRCADGKVLSREKTGYPIASGVTLFPSMMTRDASGAFIAEMRVADPKTPSKASLAYYAWTPETKSWTGIQQNMCEGNRLIGMNHNAEIFVHLDSNTTVCSYSRP